MIAIGTVGALVDVPDNTSNILAWNGGGKANYSEIVDDGGYSMKKPLSSMEARVADLKTQLSHIVEELEHMVLDN